MKRYSCLTVAFFFPLLASFQTAKNAQTTENVSSGPCSPPISGNKGIIDIRCSGLTSEEQEILHRVPGLLNKILAEHLTKEEASKLFSRLNSQLANVQSSLDELRTNPGDPNRGLLIPANEADPSTKCHVQNDWFKLYLGSTVISAPQPNFVLSINDTQALVLKTENSGINISAVISDASGTKLGRIRDNYFHLYETYFRKEQTASSLTVFDERDPSPVLRVSYLNRKAVYITGRFSDGKVTATVSDQSILLDPGHNSVNSNCFVGKENSTIKVLPYGIVVE